MEKKTENHKPEMLPDTPLDVKATLATHGAEIVGLKNGMSRLERGMNAILDKLDSSNQPKTFAILTAIGGAVALVMTASQILLSLTVSPIRKDVSDLDDLLNRRAELILKMMEKSAENKQLTLNTSANLEGYEIHANEVHELTERNTRQWREHHLADFENLRDRMIDVEKDNAACEAKHAATLLWLQKIDNIGTRNQVNR